MKKLLDLGCGIRKRDGAIGVDIAVNNVVDVVHDLNIYPYPFADNEVDDVLMDNSLEHLADVVKTMEEIFRITKHKGSVKIKVPYFRSHYAIDPTHLHYFVSHSFYYFDPTHIFHKYYKYSDATFKVEKVVFDDGHKYPLLKKIIYSVPRWIANKSPMLYENYFGHIFPMSEITFFLKVIKS